MTPRVALLIAAALAALTASVTAQRAGAFGASRDHPAIAYTDGPVATVVSDVNQKLQQGTLRFSFDPVSGYLRSVLDALAIPIESQVLVYSETSFQARRINMRNPRAVFFTDRAAVGFVRGGDVLEVAVQDPRQGMVFYLLNQTAGATAPQFARNDQCLSCHLSWETLAVPGPFVLSVLPRRSDSEYAGGGHVDHRSPIAERWGGWYVTGARVPARQLGNIALLQPDLPASGPKPVAAKPSLEGVFDLAGYPTPFSDVVALMVLEHQTRATNLITRAGWEFRQAVHEGGNARPNGDRGEARAVLSPRVTEAVGELADYLLFVDEAPLPAAIRGSSGFAEQFATRGPRDRKGRSLRELQLETRLLRYPCSYMINSPGFEGLPPPVKTAVYRRIWDVISGKDANAKYAHLTRADRQAIGEILSDTTGFAESRQ